MVNQERAPAPVAAPSRNVFCVGAETALARLVFSLSEMGFKVK